ncbi:hypothetical protein LRP67_15475 [Nocardioides sp. cx-169]|uniref:hypothetical protein n=1 Tax=Nocardioides sp. cx-169 TaxID=2899080 RepID=UPI001E4A3564|nr:hypothetical protein [Nocardioides sp. cx-169]MCD4535490.1 hypothetical protein [Nocardioides sp. cx-169]
MVAERGVVFVVGLMQRAPVMDEVDAAELGLDRGLGVRADTVEQLPALVGSGAGHGITQAPATDSRGAENALIHKGSRNFRVSVVEV